MSIRDEGIKHEAKFRGDRLHVTTKTVHDFRLCQRFLQSKRVDFHTFGLQCDAEVKATIRGLHHTTDPETIKLDLRTRDIHATLVMPLPRQNGGSCNTFLLKVRKTGKWEDVWSVNEILGVQVAIGSYTPRHSLGQCYRCQNFGHSSIHCNLPYRCVRCAGDHAARECPNKDKDPRCCNCKGKHPASYRGCPTFQEAEKSKKRREKETRPPPPTTQAGRKQQPQQTARPAPPPGLTRGSFASVTGGAAAAGRSPAPAVVKAAPAAQNPPPQPPQEPTPAAVPDQGAHGSTMPPPPPVNREAAPTYTTRRNKQKRNKKQRQRRAQPGRPASEIPATGSDEEGDVSDMETDNGQAQTTRRPAAPTPQRQIFPPVQVEQRGAPEPAPKERDSVSVKQLIAWMTKVIPVLISSQDKSPAELIAELMTSLLSLLNDG